MVEINKMVKCVRIFVFSTTSVFALLLITLGGLIRTFNDILPYSSDLNFSSAVVGIAAGALALLTLPVMLASSKGCFISMIAFEIYWILFLWMSWLAVGVTTAVTYNSNFVVSCVDLLDLDPLGFGSLLVDACNESSALLAFAFSGWLLLLFYNSILAILTVRHHWRGNTGIWSKDVRDADFTAPPASHDLQIVFEH